MHQSTTPSLSQTIWLKWASRQFLTPTIVQTLLPVTFGYFLSSEAVIMRQLRRWKRLWRRSLTRSHKRTSMGPSRSCCNGTTSALQPKEISSKGTRVSYVYSQVPIQKKVWKLIICTSYIGVHRTPFLHFHLKWVTSSGQSLSPHIRLSHDLSKTLSRVLDQAYLIILSPLDEMLNSVNLFLFWRLAFSITYLFEPKINFRKINIIS